MNRKIWKFALIVLTVLPVLNPSALYSAEVFYLGGASGGGADGKTFPHYGLGQRARDLLNFAAYGDRSRDRSGQISGNFLQEIDWTQISGNKEKSFYERGTDYLTEINISSWEKLWRDYKYESQMFIRKTDDRRIEPRRDVRLKQLSMKIGNQTNMLEFGDFYGDFSPFTLGSSLEGFNLELEPRSTVRMKGIVARRWKSDIAANRHQRNVFGGKIDFTPIPQCGLFSLFRFGVQAITSQDDSSTKTQNTDAPDLNNTVIAVDGEINFRKYLSFVYEVARSFYIENEDNPDNKDRQNGLGLRLQPALNFGNRVIFRYLYYYCQPDFYTDIGSASADKIQNQFSFDLRFNERTMLSLVDNWYWDHLEGSTRPYRTKNDEKYATLTVRPFARRYDFTLRPYVNYLTRHSDDTVDSIKADTTTAGLSINEILWGTNVGTRYEYRMFRDLATKATSDYFHRFGFTTSRDQQVFGRRLYFSADVNFDIRRSKQDEDKDVNVGTGFTAQYDLLKNVTGRMGYNVQTMDASSPKANYVNGRSYYELDVLINRTRGTHWISRIERNVFDHEDGTQDYKELRVITKFLSQF
ncbi:MAG TPA: hypothetical protein PKL97_06660 [Candidatus Omnitrophota bacterium]|nr:hypothetical protein [Candidatus Omnitrophota bacterium]